MQPIEPKTALTGMPKQPVSLPRASPSETPFAPAERDNTRDLELLGRVSRGDRPAFDALYRTYHGRLSRFLARLTRQSDLVEEVVNDTLWTVWRSASAFRGTSLVSTWIMGIAWRSGLKALRRAGGPTLEHTADHDAAQVTEPFVEAEMHDWVRAGLQHLPVEQRTALELVYYFGHSMEEIAEIMDCPVGTVKGRLFHARIKLRNLLPALGGARLGGTDGP
jgi:RNA polymerase sigma-70 factor (ECF subfamily)